MTLPIIFENLLLPPTPPTPRKKEMEAAGFPPTLENLENLEKWDNFFQSGKSQGILKNCQKVREKSGNFKWVREKSGKTVIPKLKFNQLRIKI